MNFEENDPLNLDTVDLNDDSGEELKELSQEEEAMKVLSRIADACGLGQDEDLIRFIYTEAVQAHDNDSVDVATTGRKIYEKISSEFQQEGAGES